MSELSPECGTPEAEHGQPVAVESKPTEHGLRNGLFHATLLTVVLGGGTAFAISQGHEAPKPAKTAPVHAPETAAGALTQQQAVYGINSFISELLIRIRGVDGPSRIDSSGKLVIEQYNYGALETNNGSTDEYQFDVRGLPDATGHRVDAHGISELILQDFDTVSGQAVRYTFELVDGDWTVTSESDSPHGEQFSTNPMIVPGSQPITSLAMLQQAEAGPEQLVFQAEQQKLLPPTVDPTAAPDAPQQA